MPGSCLEAGQVSRHYIADISLDGTLNHDQPTEEDFTLKVYYDIKYVRYEVKLETDKLYYFGVKSPMFYQNHEKLKKKNICDIQICTCTYIKFYSEFNFDMSKI